jgi:ParB family chromosome partitioning protein
MSEQRAKTLPRSPALAASEQLRQVPLDSIDVGDQLVRDPTGDDELAELAADIARRGLLQPIGVRAPIAGRYQLLWGNRRRLAHLRLGRPTILARIFDDHGAVIKSTALVENLARRQLTLKEEVDGVARLHADEGLSPDQIADLLTRSRSWVLRRLAVPQLPPDLVAEAFEGTVALGTLEAIARLEDPGQRAYVLQHARASGASVVVIRELVETLRQNPSVAAAVAAGEAQLNTAPHADVYIGCQACNQPRKPEHLVTLRVCADGCAPPAATEKVEH